MYLKWWEIGDSLTRFDAKILPMHDVPGCRRPDDKCGPSHGDSPDQDVDHILDLIRLLEPSERNPFVDQIIKIFRNGSCCHRIHANLLQP